MYSSQRQRLHPLMAAASVSVILVSLVGIASLSGFMPASLSTRAALTAVVVPAAAVAARPTVVAPPVATATPSVALPASTPVKTADTLAPGETLLSESILPARPVVATVAPAMEKSAVRQAHSTVRSTVSNTARTKASASVASTEPTPRPAAPRRHAAQVAASMSGNTSGGQTHAGRGTPPGVIDPIAPVAASPNVNQDGNALPRIVPVVRPPPWGVIERGGTTRAGAERNRTLGQGIDQTLSRLVDTLGLRTAPPAPQPELSRY